MGMKYRLIETHAIRIPKNIWSVGSKSKNHTESTAVSNMALDVAYTLTIVSAYFIILSSPAPAAVSEETYCRRKPPTRERDLSQWHPPGNKQPTESEIDGDRPGNPVPARQPGGQPRAVLVAR